MGICIPEDSVEYCSLKTRTCMGEANSHITYNLFYGNYRNVKKKKKGQKELQKKKKKETPNKN